MCSGRLVGTAKTEQVRGRTKMEPQEDSKESGWRTCAGLKGS